MHIQPARRTVPGPRSTSGSGSTVLATLLSIAPEVEVALLRDNRPLRLQVDLDSMDWLAYLRARLPQASPDTPPESA